MRNDAPAELPRDRIFGLNPGPRRAQPSRRYIEGERPVAEHVKQPDGEEDGSEEDMGGEGTARSRPPGPALHAALRVSPRTAEDRAWVLDEDCGGLKKGAVVTLPAGSVGDENRALGPASEGSGVAGLVTYRSATLPPGPSDSGEGEARSLPVLLETQGERLRPFADAVATMDTSEVPGGFVLSSPRTCLNLLKPMVRIGGTPEVSHMMWKRESHIPDGDRAVYENGVPCLVLQIFTTVDQVNCANLVGCSSRDTSD